MTGFTSGCDDYFTKPFSPVKLTMRVNAIIKRQTKKDEEPSSIDMAFEDISIDSSLKTFKIGDDYVKLTATEFDMMEYFLKNKARAVSREELLYNIWGYENAVETRVTDDTIKRIRTERPRKYSMKKWIIYTLRVRWLKVYNPPCKIPVY